MRQGGLRTTLEPRSRVHGATLDPKKAAAGRKSQGFAAEGDLASFATVVQTAEFAAAALPNPLEYIVVAPTAISVRERPNAHSREVGQLLHGCVVQGFPGKGWLHLSKGGSLERSFEGYWVFIGSRLEAVCMRVGLQRSFTEAVAIAWQGLPTQRTGYSIEWQLVSRLPAGDPRAGIVNSVTNTPAGADGYRGGHTVTRDPEVLLGGLPPGAKVRVRAAARVFAPACSDADVRVLGPWCELETLPSFEDTEGSDASRRQHYHEPDSERDDES